MDQLRAIVAVHPPAALRSRPRLFAALEAAFPVRFTGETGAADGLIRFGDAAPARSSGTGVPTVHVQEDAACTRDETIAFSASPALDARLRGMGIPDRIAPEREPEPAPVAGAETLASAGGGPVWTRAPGHLDRVGASLPELGPDGGLWLHLLRRPVGLLAVTALLRRLCARDGDQEPGLQAAMVFDDPNLRWRSYGHIDYRRLVAHADAHGYHAAMAMIPLDAGRAHGATVELFDRRRDRLSLVFHGNDHIKRELTTPADRRAALALAAQALRRVEGFERRSQLRVDRIMMPPHGMCSREMAAALAALGFDGLCAIHPLPWTEERPGWLPLLGWQPGSWVEGCPVLPRVHFSAPPFELNLRAYLGHPLVLYGHHDDVAGGLEPLAEAAARVNALGDVAWRSVGDIARAGYAAQRTDGVLAIAPRARRLDVRLADTSGAFTVVRPPDVCAVDALAGWSSDGGRVRAFGDPVPARGASFHRVRIHGGGDVDPDRVPPPAWTPWPRLRRTATEARDRMMPLRPSRARA